jgi:hypothetical protein
MAMVIVGVNRGLQPLNLLSPLIIRRFYMHDTIPLLKYIGFHCVHSRYHHCLRFASSTMSYRGRGANCGGGGGCPTIDLNALKDRILKSYHQWRTCLEITTQVSPTERIIQRWLKE